jgi:hypothetical protein
VTTLRNSLWDCRHHAATIRTDPAVSSRVLALTRHSRRQHQNGDVASPVYTLDAATRNPLVNLIFGAKDEIVLGNKCVA